MSQNDNKWVNIMLTFQLLIIDKRLCDMVFSPDDNRTILLLLFERLDAV